MPAKRSRSPSYPAVACAVLATLQRELNITDDDFFSVWDTLEEGSRGAAAEEPQRTASDVAAHLISHLQALVGVTDQQFLDAVDHGDTTTSSEDSESESDEEDDDEESSSTDEESE